MFLDWVFHFTIIAQHEDVFIISLHEITLTGNLLHRLRISVQLTDPRLITTIIGIIFLRLFLQLFDALHILKMAPEAVIIEEADNDHTDDSDNGILEEQRMPYAEQEYIVSARKYRPITFDSVVGQAALTTTLKNAVKSGKLAHAYLFCGPRGVGKTTCARIFAKAINCQNPTAEGEACNECESCQSFNEQRSLNIFELDAASNNSVEHIKTLMEQTRIPPQLGRYKVFIIDEVHMLSTAAFNAFLKTLEEPPAHVIFILATTEKHKILPTILSRCQIYDFERMTIRNMHSPSSIRLPHSVKVISPTRK